MWTSGFFFGECVPRTEAAFFSECSAYEYSMLSIFKYSFSFIVDLGIRDQ